MDARSANGSCEILDAGCGMGMLSQELLKRLPGLRVTGADYSVVLEIAVNNAARLGVSERFIYISPSLHLTTPAAVTVVIDYLNSWLTLRDEELRPSSLPVPLYTVINMQHLRIEMAAGNRYGDGVRSMMDAFSMVIFRYGVSFELEQTIRLQAPRQNYGAFLCPSLQSALEGIAAHRKGTFAAWLHQIELMTRQP